MQKTKVSRQFKSGMGAALMLFTWAAVSPAMASEMVYVPLNPSFGGNPLNGPVLLNSAQATNRHTDPDAGNDFVQQTPLQQFNDSLERSLLSRLSAAASAQLVDGTTGVLKPGSVDTGNFKIDIVDTGGGSLRLTTTDKITGASTSFQVGK